MVGAGVADPELSQRAETVGALLARAGAVIVCGGLGGVMEAACKGARSEGGLTVGLLPGDVREPNPYVDVAIATGLGEMRNALIGRTADVLVAIGGEFGTLSEIAFALKIGKPVVGLDTWELAKPSGVVNAITLAASPEEAVERALVLARG